MNNLLISTIRFGAVAGLALFAMFFIWAGEVFAAPVLTPPIAFDISRTSATLSVKAVNQVSRSTTVWFEWGTTPNPTTIVGMRDVFNEGYTEGYLRGILEPNTTYYFRGAAMEGGVTVYTPVMSFVTKGDTSVTNTTTIVNNTRVVNTTEVNNTATMQAREAQAMVSSSKVASATKTPAAKSGAATSDNVQTAAALGANDSVLPGTLIGWVALLVAMLLAVLVGHMVYEQTEKRKKKNEDTHADETGKK